ncbi:MAG: hypothetical protein WD845_04110 [Pirellulales bacterium]
MSGGDIGVDRDCGLEGFASLDELSTVVCRQTQSDECAMALRCDCNCPPKTRFSLRRTPPIALQFAACQQGVDVVRFGEQNGLEATGGGRQVTLLMKGNAKIGASQQIVGLQMDRRAIASHRFAQVARSAMRLRQIRVIVSAARL